MNNRRRLVLDRRGNSIRFSNIYYIIVQIGFVNEENYPYMKFTRVYENEKVIWKKEKKDQLSKDQLDIIISMTSDDVKKLPTEDKFIWLYSTFEKTQREVGRKQGRNSSAPIILLVERCNFLRDSFELQLTLI